MKKLFLATLILIVSFTLQGQTFIPVDPISWINEVEAELDLVEAEDYSDVLNMLPNETVDVNIGIIQDDGTISYSLATLTEKGKTYLVTMDYMRYRSEKMEGVEESGLAKIGIGLRLTAKIIAKEKGVDLGSLFAIAAAVQEKKISGSINVDILGITNKDVTITVPIPGELNQTSIQNAMQTLATVKAKMYDSDAVLTPQIFAVKAKSTDSADQMIGNYLDKNKNNNSGYAKRNTKDSSPIIAKKE